jgi:hypothetical protein
MQRDRKLHTGVLGYRLTAMFVTPALHILGS